MSEELTQEELVDVIYGAVVKAREYWEEQLGLGISIEDEKRISETLNKLEQAYTQLKEQLQQKPEKQTVTREWLLEWREKNSAARFCWLHEDVIYLLKELGVVVEE